MWIQIGLLLTILARAAEEENSNKPTKPKSQRPLAGLALDVAYFTTTLLFLLAWQFSHYVLLTQIASLIATYVIVPFHVPTIWKLSVLRLMVMNTISFFFLVRGRV